VLSRFAPTTPNVRVVRLANAAIVARTITSYVGGGLYVSPARLLIEPAVRVRRRTLGARLCKVVAQGAQLYS
jgi:hypothetical protein